MRNKDKTANSVFVYTKVDDSDTAICSFQAFDNNFNTQNHSGLEKNNLFYSFIYCDSNIK